MPSEESDGNTAASPDEDGAVTDAPVIGGGSERPTLPPVAEARAGVSPEHVIGALAGREAEEFLLPSWTAGATIEAPAEKPDRSRKLIREIIETVLLALLVFLAVRASLQNYLVEGFSMFPTLDNGQHILVNKLGYAEINMDRLTDFIPFVDAEDGDVREVFGGPKRGDVIVFESTAGSGNDLIKRVVGLPGERILILDGRVYINGLLLNEPYITEAWSDTRGEVLVPERHYYVLGDNRNSSQDSRSRRIGMVPREQIVGKSLLTYWPFRSFGLAPNGGTELTETTLQEVLQAESERAEPAEAAEPDEPAEPADP